MAGLVLSLRPYEKVLIGGVVVQNGASRTSLRVEAGAVGVLRMSDAMHPGDARTPLTRCYYAAQLMLLGQGEAAVLERLLSDARAGFRGFAFGADLAAAEAAAREGAWFRVMRRLRPLLPQEAALLSDPRFRPPDAVPDLPQAAMVMDAERTALTAG